MKRELWTRDDIANLLRALRAAAQGNDERASGFREGISAVEIAFGLDAASAGQDWTITINAPIRRYLP